MSQEGKSIEEIFYPKTAQKAAVETASSDRSLEEVFYPKSSKVSAPPPSEPTRKTLISDGAEAIPVIQEQSNTSAPEGTKETNETKEEGESETDAEEAFYPRENATKTYAASLKPGFEQIQAEFDVRPELIEQSKQETATLFHDMKIPAAEARGLHELYVRHVIKPADEATVESWEKAASDQMRSRYGKDAEARLVVAKGWLREHPREAKALELTGLGSHPEVVLTIADRAWSARAHGKLKSSGK